LSGFDKQSNQNRLGWLRVGRTTVIGKVGGLNDWLIVRLRWEQQAAASQLIAINRINPTTSSWQLSHE
jgi:hypothetical protein